MSFEPFLIGFLLGAVVGALFIVFALKSDSGCSSSADLSTLLSTQIAFQQQQNMLREMQLQQARQEAEYRNLEQQKAQACALSQSATYGQLTLAVRNELERQKS